MFLRYLLLGFVMSLGMANRLFAADPTPPKTIAAIVTAYYHNSHADVLASRMLESNTLDNQGSYPNLKLVSLYTDQVPANDKSRKLAEKHGFRIFAKPEEALTLGTGKLAVDGVLLIAEHGVYPDNEFGSIAYPKRKLFDAIARVCEQSERSVPVFCDKHLADTWTDAKHIYDTARRLKMPLMAGSSLPVLWRFPSVDVARDASLKEMVAVSYHRLDVYGFHALEMCQALAERRRGGETGVKAVQCLEGPAVWEAATKGLYDRKLLDEALARMKDRRLLSGRRLEDLVPMPSLFQIEYRDGFRVSVLTLNGAVADWAAAWRYADQRVESTCFWTQEARPFMHFGFQMQGIEQMFHSGEATWPVERTLLTSGVLDSLLVSRKKNGERLLTPHLDMTYQTSWNWLPPPPAPKGRPIPDQ